MNTTRRTLCWLLVAALVISGIVGVTALAGHTAAAQQADCASMDTANHAMVKGEAHASVQLADCDSDPSDCLDVRCVQSQGVLPAAVVALPAAPTSPLLASEQKTPSRSPLPAYRPPRT